MFKSERHGQILRILEEKQFASVAYLSQTLFASMPTVRRDLNYLENEGYVRRSHGGAVLSSSAVNAPVSFRSGKKMQEKQQMCRLAATLVQDGDVIMLDASTTVLPLAAALADKDQLTVVTNGLKVAQVLSENAHIQAFVTGGRILHSSLAFVGNGACEFVSSFHADVIFFSSSSLDYEGQITDYSEDETVLRRTMFRHAARRVFLCDSSKVGRSSAFRLGSLADMDAVITDAPLPETMSDLSLFEAEYGDGAILYRKKK